MELSINSILKQVKSSKKYKTISDEIVLSEIKDYLNKNKTAKITKQDIKLIRSKLHKLYSSYQTTKKSKREKYLRELKQTPNNINIINKILSANISTKERLEDYENLYNQIFKITGIPDSITDLGCGLNPISFQYMNLESIDYYAYDIDESDIKFLNNYFQIMKNKGLNGKAQILDIRDFSKISNLLSSDIVFLFKVIDLIDINNHKPSEELIKYLINNKAKFIIASFATKTISKRAMNFPNRKWFELMLARIGLKFKILKTKNEIFYVIHQ